MIILAIVALVAGIILAITLKKKYFIAIGAAVCVLAVAYTCVTTVPTGHTGVVTVFGRVADYTLDSGFHIKAPWEKIVLMDNRVQKRTENLACFSSDIQEVKMIYTVNYQISKKDAMTLYRTVGEAYYDTVITPNIAESVKVATAQYTAEDLVGKRDSLANDIETVLSEKLKSYNIDVVSTSIEDMDFTEAFTDAVEAKQVAAQNKLRAQTEAEQKISEAQAAADVKKVNADAAAYEVLKKAEAEAEANTKLAASITDTLIDYLYAQGWDGKLPYIVSGKDGGLLINAADLIRPETADGAEE